MMLASQVSTASALSMILVVGLSTYLFRSGVILFIGDKPLPHRFVRTLQSVAPAVLSALVVTQLAGSEGLDGIDLSEIAGVVAGGLTARLAKNLIAGLAVGMAVFYVLEAIV